MTNGTSIRWGRLALSALMGLQLALAGSFVAAADADAASVLCQNLEKKKKLRVREDVCKNNERKVQLGGGGQAAVDPRVDELERRMVLLLDEKVDERDLRNLERRVTLAEDAATAPIDNDRLRLERETIRIPGVEGEMSVTSEDRHEYCAITRVMYNQDPGFDGELHRCKVTQNDDRTWTMEGPPVAKSQLFCDATCF